MQVSGARSHVPNVSGARFQVLSSRIHVFLLSGLILVKTWNVLFALV